VVQPDDIDDLVHELRSVESLNESCRCGLELEFSQMRRWWLDRPVRLAIEVRDQCVASFGVDSKVATTTSSTPVQRTRAACPDAAHRPARPSRSRRTGHAIVTVALGDPEFGAPACSSPTRAPRTVLAPERKELGWSCPAVPTA